MEKKTARPYVPGRITHQTLREASQRCHGCDLYKNAIQAVFGEGQENDGIMLVGEQPDEHEDQEGHPFVGPAGQILSRALVDAGINRDSVYITNAVKHFKWSAQGKRKIHKKPSTSETAACKPWLEEEVKLLQPEIIVCMGATACLSVFGHEEKIRDLRSQFHSSPWCENTFVTVHPSAISRVPDELGREREYRAFVNDLKLVNERANHLRSRRSLAA